MQKTGKISVVRRAAVGAVCAGVALATCYTAMALQADVKPATEVKIRAVHLSAGAAVGYLRTKVAPKYPAEAKKARIEGTVVLNAVIGEDGHVTDLKAVSGPEELRGAAMDAVRQWVYRPYLLNGKPTKVETKINVIYTLGDRPPAEAAPEAGASATPKKVAWDTPPVSVKAIEAAYPPVASAAHMDGVVLVRTKIGADGRTTVLDATGPSMFQQSAMAAVEQAVFRPATKDGKPTESTVTIEVNFKLYDRKPAAKSDAEAGTSAPQNRQL